MKTKKTSEIMANLANDQFKECLVKEQPCERVYVSAFTIRLEMKKLNS